MKSLKTADKNSDHEPTEIIVVFKKDVPDTQAKNILNQFSCVYREGMDCSRSKNYFYETGPKFIVVTPMSNSERLINAGGRIKEIHEAYPANWELVKD